MRLRLDENLSSRLVRALADVYPGSIHVRDVGLAAASDDEVWTYAAARGLTIVSKDAEFHERSFLFGQPPKVLTWRLRAESARPERAIVNTDSLEVPRHGYGESPVAHRGDSGPF